MNTRRLVRGVWFIVALVGLTSGSLFSQTADASGPIAEAKTVEVEKEILLRSEIVEYAEKFLGTHYRSAGRTPSGFDCSGFVSYVMKEYEIKMNGSSASQEGQGKRISKKDAKPGDLVFFRRSPKGRVHHVAMVYENDESGMTIIHSASRGVVIEKIEDSEYWSHKIMTFRNVVSDDRE